MQVNINDRELNSQLASMFQQLKLPAAHEKFCELQTAPATMQASFEEKVYYMLRDEIESRRKRKTLRLLKESRIMDDVASIDLTEFSEERGLNEGFIRSLGTCEWINSPTHEWILISGKAGTGKTWLVKSLVRAAVEHGHKSLYVKVPTLIRMVDGALREGLSSSLKNKLNNLELLALDDLNLQEASDGVRNFLLEVLDDRWNKKALIIASQHHVDQWYEYIGGTSDVRDAYMDRLVNGSHFIELKGASMRERRRIG